MTRPHHKPSPQSRRQVSAAAALGMSHATIAAALGICRNSLTKHYFEELTRAKAQIEVDALDALFLAAKRGNVTALVAFIRRMCRDPEPRFGQGNLGR
jgi:hypothetical protein